MMRTHHSKTTPTLRLLALSALLVTQLLLTPMPPAQAHHGKPHINWAALDLSGEQHQRLQQLDTQWAQTYNRLHPQIKQDQDTLRQLMESPDATPEAMMRVQNRLERNRHQLHKSATRILMQKKQSLTDDQRQQLHDMMAPTATAAKARPRNNPRGMTPASHRH